MNQSPRVIAKEIDRLVELTPHAEAVREWMRELPENEYWQIIDDIGRLFSRCKFMRTFGMGATFELYATYVVNRVLGYYSPEKVNRKREWRKN